MYGSREGFLFGMMSVLVAYSIFRSAWLAIFVVERCVIYLHVIELTLPLVTCRPSPSPSAPINLTPSCPHSALGPTPATRFQ